jgi:hypothetical protein
MKTNPVLWYGSLLALLTTVTTFGGVDDHIPSEVLFWIRLGTAVVAAAGAVWVRSQVTPLADPRGGEDGKQPLIVDPDPQAKAKREAGVS